MQAITKNPTKKRNYCLFYLSFYSMKVHICNGGSHPSSSTIVASFVVADTFWFVGLVKT